MRPSRLDNLTGSAGVDPIRPSLRRGWDEWLIAGASAFHRLSPSRTTPLTRPRGREAEGARGETLAGAALSGCILAVARRSDHAAFAVLFSHFAPRLKTYLLHAGTMNAGAEEQTQETMVLVWRKADRFAPRKAAASSGFLRSAATCTRPRFAVIGSRPPR